MLILTLQIRWVFFSSSAFFGPWKDKTDLRPYFIKVKIEKILVSSATMAGGESLLAFNPIFMRRARRRRLGCVLKAERCCRSSGQKTTSRIIARWSRVYFGNSVAIDTPLMDPCTFDWVSIPGCSSTFHSLISSQDECLSLARYPYLF